MKQQPKWIRSYHRDMGYFYVGLIISFSISGIALNHRTVWDSQDYTYLKEELNTKPFSLNDIDENVAKSMLISINQQSENTLTFRGFRTNRDKLSIFLDGGTISIDPATGKGELEMFRMRPVMGQMTWLHKTTNATWIWYSDIFGLGMLFIAITGMFITAGKNSFRKRGYLLALGGMVFPVILLIILT